MWTKLGCGIFVLMLLAGCTDHSREFIIDIEADEESWVDVYIDGVKIEKTGNTEESTNSPEGSLEATIPVAGAL